jgi:hypothetical protein
VEKGAMKQVSSEGPSEPERDRRSRPAELDGGGTELKTKKKPLELPQSLRDAKQTA